MRHAIIVGKSDVKELQTALYDLGEVSASEREARVLYHSTFAQLEQTERELQTARRLLREEGVFAC